MKRKRMLLISMIMVLVLALATGLTRAQGPETPTEGVEPEGGSTVEAAVSGVIPIQGRLTDASGRPLNGSYSIRASIYDVASGGTALCSKTQSVSVSNGLFNMTIDNCTSDGINGQQLYLGIRVGTDAEMTPRQPIYPVPYAWSLRPGARIVDSKDFPDFILQVQNTGSGRAIQASTNGHTAIEGWNGNTAAGKWGVWGGSANGIGVEGTSQGTNGIGVKGQSQGTNGIGVRGQSQGTSGFGVFGYASATTGTTYGVAGQSDSPSGRGVNGYASANTGTNFGVYGETHSTSGYGVAGFQTGYSTGDTGTYWESGGLFGGRNGVIGISKEAGGIGVVGWAKATTANSRGVYARTESPAGWAGYFYTGAGNGVYVSAPAGKTGLNVAGGTKNAVVRAEGGSRLLYTEESTEVWFTDYGFGKLRNGVAAITIDPLFAQTVNLNEPYHVFVQPYGDASLYVANRTPTGFEVRLHDGDPNAEFSYRIVAVRLGYETTRLERAPWADNDPNLYPEKRTTWEAEQGGAP